MRRVEAMEVLRALARDEADANPVALCDLADTIRKDWPDSFADILTPPPDLVGRRSPISARDVHLEGLLRAIEQRRGLGCVVATAKLRYHCRWLRYLREPGREAPPRVSIIIPIYNRAWLVDSLIQNCLDQSYSQIEIVVVDDGSTDATAARLATFGDRIKLIRRPNGGVSAARNAAVLTATGELLHFLDSDNLLHDQHVEVKVGAFASIPDADLCHCSGTDVSLFGVKPFLHHPYNVREGETSPIVDLLDSMVTNGFPFPVSSVTMPRHTFLHNGFFDTDLQRAEDARYWFRLALAGVKVIGLTRRLFYRCRMTDGLNETRRLDDTASIIVRLRNVVDLLRRPEQWPAVAEYMSRRPGDWDRLLNRGDAYGRDFDILLETIADLPSTGRSSNRSPLPLLVFLWMLSERGRTPEATAPLRQASLRDLLANALIAAMVGAESLGQVDKEGWVCRAPKLRANAVFTEMPWVAATSKLSNHVGPKLDETVAFLQSIAGVARGRNAVIGTAHTPQEKRPRATIVVPILADPSAAEATIASCLAQTVADRIEILAVEKDKLRSAFWAEKYPQLQVIIAELAGSLVEAHAAGLAAAKSALIRFLLPGDILATRSVARQIKASKSFQNAVVVTEDKGRDSNQPGVPVGPLEVWSGKRPRTTFSAMLFPRSVLARVGGFDLSLGEAYQVRYLFRLTAAGVSGAFIKSASIYAKPPGAPADQLAIAALSNLIECLGNGQLWRHIPTVARALSASENNVEQNRELHSLKTRVIDFAFKAICELSAASRSPLAALALCLVGLEWGRPEPRLRPRAPLLETLHSALLNAASGLALDTLGKLSLTEALRETGGDPSFAKATKAVFKAVHEGPQFAGLRDALRHLQESKKLRESCRSTPKLAVIERLKWKRHGPSSITDDLEFRGRLKLAATSPVAFAQFRTHVLEKITELNFEAGAQYAESFLKTSPSYQQLLPEFRRNDEVGDPASHQYPQIGRFSAATLRYIKFLSDMEILFGSLNGFHIVEIGGGYGGQCRLIMSRFKPASYTMIDLPEMLHLASRYLGTFDIDKSIAFRRPFQRLPKPSADLVISNYAVSEMKRSVQDRYLLEVINPARRGYILYNANNATALNDCVQRQTGEAPYDSASFAARIEASTIETAWPLLVERDRTLGSVLIYWNRGKATGQAQT